MTTIDTAEETGNEWLPDPRQCPSWCNRTHAEALAEGNGWEDSQQHIFSGPGETLSELAYADRPCRPWGGGWNMRIVQRPLGPNGGYWGPALVDIDFDGPNWRGLTLSLTSGEARTLARQLEAMADRIDL